MGSQFLQGPVHADLQGSGTAPKDGGQIGAAEFGFPGEQQQFPFLSGQAIQGGRQTPLILSCFKLSLGAFRGRKEVRMEFQGHLESVARAVIRQHIPGDAVEPRSEGGSRLEAPRIAEYPEKDLLDEILAQGFLAGETEEKPVEWSVVAIEENG